MEQSSFLQPAIPLETNLPSLLLSKDHGSQVAFQIFSSKEETSISYFEWQNKIQQTALWWKNKKIEKGDRVLFVGSNSLDLIRLELGLMIAGGVSIVLPTNIDPKKISPLLLDLSPKYIVIELSKQEKYKDLLPKEKCILLEPEQDLISSKSLSDSEKNTIKKMIENLCTKDSATIVCTKGGTNSSPKGALLTHGNILATMRSMLASLKIFPENTFYIDDHLSSIFHRVGSVFIPLFLGLPIHLQEENRSNSFLSFSTFAPHIIFTSASKIKILQEKLEQKFQQNFIRHKLFSRKKGKRLLQKYFFSGHQFSFKEKIFFFFYYFWILKYCKKILGKNLYFMLISFEKLPPETINFFHSLGIRIGEVYSMAEIPFISINNPNRMNTLGKPAQGVQVAIGKGSEILISSSQLSSKYFGQEELSKKNRDFGGRIKTGDQGEFDLDGNIILNDV